MYKYLSDTILNAIKSLSDYINTHYIRSSVTSKFSFQIFYEGISGPCHCSDS